MANAPLLTFREKAKAGEVPVDLPTLLTTRGLIQGSPGSGKSWLARQMHEQTHGRVPHWIIDSEGEMYTLRERFPYILIGRAEGELQPQVPHAALLVRHLAEIDADVIFDLTEMKLRQQREYMSALASAMIELPQSLWRHRLLHIAEVAVYAPQEGKVESTEAVLELARRGRKRGWGLVCDTQRISSLDKDVAFALQNVFVGFTGLDVDVDRAARRLGFRTKEQREELTQLPVGTFFLHGPALSKTVVKARSVHETLTTHPSPTAMRPPVPPTPDKVMAIVAQLANVPKEAEAEARTLEQLKARVIQLERETREAKRELSFKPTIDEGAIDQARRDAAQMEWERHDRVRKVISGHLKGAIDAAATLAEGAHLVARSADEITHRLQGVVTKLVSHRSDLEAIGEVLAKEYPVESPQRNAVQRDATSRNVVRRDRPIEQRIVVEPPVLVVYDDGALTAAQTKLLVATRQASHLIRGPAPRRVVAAFAGVRAGTGSFNKTVGTLAQLGLVETGGGEIRLLAAGFKATDDIPLPRGEHELQDAALALFTPSQAAILSEAIRAWPNTITRTHVAEMLGVKTGTGSFNAMIGEMTRTGLLTTPQGGHLRASDHLFPESRRR
jgi:hypothetical protein